MQSYYFFIRKIRKKEKIMKKIVILLSVMLFMVACEKGNEEMKEAKLVEQEKPFYFNIKANEIYDVKSEEDILVQGIIDLYYINKNDELVLVDYKTDYVENNDEESLKEKYDIQLAIYKKALEKALDRKVDKVYIYSTWLARVITINFEL